MNIPGYTKSYATLSSEEMIKLASSTKKAANAPYGYSYGSDGYLHYRQGAIGGSTAYDGDDGARLAGRMQAKYSTPDMPTTTPKRTKSWYDEDYRKEVAMRSPTNRENAKIINKNYDTSTLEGRRGLAAAQALWQKQYDGAVRELMRVYGDKWRARGFTESQINNFVHNDVMKSLERRGIANYPGAQQQNEEPVIYTAPQTVMNRGQQQPKYDPLPKAEPAAEPVVSPAEAPSSSAEPAASTAEETPATEPAASTAEETPSSTTVPQAQTEYGPQPASNPMDPDSYYDQPLPESEVNALFNDPDSDLETPTTEPASSPAEASSSTEPAAAPSASPAEETPATAPAASPAEASSSAEPSVDASSGAKSLATESDPRNPYGYFANPPDDDHQFDIFGSTFSDADNTIDETSPYYNKDVLDAADVKTWGGWGAEGLPTYEGLDPNRGSVHDRVSKRLSDLRAQGNSTYGSRNRAVEDAHDEYTREAGDILENLADEHVKRYGNLTKNQEADIRSSIHTISALMGMGFQLGDSDEPGDWRRQSVGYSSGPFASDYNSNKQIEKLLAFDRIYSARGHEPGAYLKMVANNMTGQYYTSGQTGRQDENNTILDVAKEADDPSRYNETGTWNFNKLPDIHYNPQRLW